MKAALLIKERLTQGKNGFVELILWRVHSPIAGSEHPFKYRLALVINDVCVLRYDNEVGKGDHKHIGHIEINYIFESPKKLLTDFWHDVKLWREKHE